MEEVVGKRGWKVPKVRKGGAEVRSGTGPAGVGRSEEVGCEDAEAERVGRKGAEVGEAARQERVGRKGAEVEEAARQV